jgi:Zn-dependent M28 family amino/carboxypeptidase
VRAIRLLLALASAGAALACGPGEAVAPPTTAPEAAPETAIEKRVDSDRLMSTVGTLASPEYGGRRTGSEGSHLARQLIAARFRAAGLPPLGESYELPFRFSHYSIRGLLEKDRPFRTVYTDAASLAAATPDNGTRIILVSAHYDHLGVRRGQLFPGADDNASGVAALLETADWFAAHPPRHRFVFVAFDAEELGLKGAEAFVEDEPVELDDVALEVNFDMLARNDRNEIYAAGVMRYPFLQPVLDQVRQHSRVKVLYGHDQPGGALDDWTAQSDQAPFAAEGIPFLYFGVDDHADYHRPSDIADKIDPRFFSGVADMVLETLIRLDRSLPN